MTVLQRRLSDPFLLERGSTACLLIHGFSGSPAELRPLGEYLAARDITVRAPLLPGHGTRPEDLRGVRWPQWVRVAEAELCDLKERYARVHVAGFSMGALVSLYLAAHHRVESVTTMACPVKLNDWRQVFLPLAKHLIPYYPTKISNPEVAAQVESYDRLPVDAIHSLTHLAKQVRKDLQRVTAPVLALQGERDKWIAPGSGEAILAGVGSAEKELRILPGRNHMITLERGREEVFAAVEEWLRLH